MGNDDGVVTSNKAEQNKLLHWNEGVWVYSKYSVHLGQKTKTDAQEKPSSVRSAYVYGTEQRSAPGTPSSAQDPLIWGDVAKYVRIGQYVGIKYHRTHVRSDPSYAKVFFNIIMYYVLLCDVRENIRDAW